MFKTGLVSATFRKLGADRIVDLCQEARLDGIEWGGDIHVPHGNMDTALDVKFMTDDASLDVISYGSYYRLGKFRGVLPSGIMPPGKLTPGMNPDSDLYDDSGSWSDVVLCAEALGAPNIRVWAGNKGSLQSTEAERNFWIQNARMIAEILADSDINLSFEYHGGTLTDTSESAVNLIRSIDCPNAKLYWQPNQFISHGENLKELEKVLPYLSNVHVFAWEGNIKFPLKHHRRRWLDYLEKISLYDEKLSHSLLLEFVKDDSEDQFISDSEELHNILSRL